MKFKKKKKKGGGGATSNYESMTSCNAVDKKDKKNIIGILCIYMCEGTRHIQ